jgi:pristinamycin I synthase-3/4
VVWRDQHVTYRELDERANRFAWQLRDLGAGPEKIVALCAERSVEIVVGLLAILKAGGAYLPLDVTHPIERLRQVANNAQADVLLTTGALIEKLSVLGARSIRLDEPVLMPERRSDRAPTTRVHPDNLAYLIYTSGSTGQPKGVAASHRGAVNYLADLQRRVRLSNRDRVLQIAPITFDAALRDLMGTLFAGATVVLLDPEAVQDPKLLIRVAVNQHVTQILAVTPSRLETLLACGEPVHTVHRVLVAGEALHRSTWRRLRQMCAPDVEVVNLYGPTEAVLTSTIYRVASDDGSNADSAEGIVPLGRPIDNRRLYVLDADLRPVDIGIPGEAWIGGEGITRGYWAAPGLTAQRFVADPFAVGERMYRTGDRVRQQNDGNLQFLGRLDQQIKLRGFRVELGEIEAVLMEHEDVARAAVVLADDSSNGQRLLAYVVAKKDRIVDIGKLRGYSKNRLPDYMVPAAFTVLDALPLNVNGKLDRKSLPKLDVAEQFRERYEPPQTPVQNAIADIWNQLLDAGRIGIHDNFFELGGHSLLAMRAAARLRQEIHIEVPVRVLFEMPTVELLAEYVENVLWIRDQAASGAISP